VTPAVSVVIPTRDRRATLGRALASVAAQGFRDFEVIVVDDGSRDDTTDWLRAHHPAATVLALPTARGAAGARNAGLARARAPIVAFLDDDDVWEPSYLATQVAALAAHPDVVLCSTGHVEIDRHGRVFRPDAPPLFDDADPAVRLLAECPIHTLSVVACRRTAFERVGPFDESLAIVHDLDWYVRCAAAGGRTRHGADVHVARGVPGGLVTRHRAWYAEERGAQARWFEQLALSARARARVRTARALFFAKVALAKGDVAFALARIGEALAASPGDGLRIARRRLLSRPAAHTPAYGGRS
jgi:glycosyltransferase involved in cell wall biosynthesis